MPLPANLQVSAVNSSVLSSLDFNKVDFHSTECWLWYIRKTIEIYTNYLNCSHSANTSGSRFNDIRLTNKVVPRGN